MSTHSSKYAFIKASSIGIFFTHFDPLCGLPFLSCHQVLVCTSATRFSQVAQRDIHDFCFVEKLEKISAWNLAKVRSKKEVIDEARASGATVHFASLMDICHLKNAELEAKHPKVQRSSCTSR